MKEDRTLQKLRSTQGTSIFFGILFFLIASILSIVMLNGAVTAVKNVQSDRKNEQSFLTCSSAAKTLRDLITETKVICTRQTEIQADGQKTEKDPNWTSDPGMGETYLIKWLQALADHSVAGSSLNKQLTIQLQSAQAEHVDPVRADITITEDRENTWNDQYHPYDITMVLSVGTGLDACQLTLTLNGDIKGEQQESGNVRTDTITYTWTAKRIIFGTTPVSEDTVQ